MLDEATRTLLYPLGFVATLTFALRFAVQWLVSEAKKESVVPVSFWYISLIGNLVLFTHGMIQVQYHVALIQGCGAIISSRNLNLMQSVKYQLRKRTVFTILGTVIVFITAFFTFQDAGWFRQPVTGWEREGPPIAFAWHLIGFSGMILFSLRFWIQWWCAELKEQSYLGPAFWWMSVAGGSLMSTYFYLIGDPVNLIGPSLGMIPYIRNLILLKRQSATA